MIAPVTKCIFCGSQNLTKEHVFSRWTHKYMPARQPGRREALRGTKFATHEEFNVVKITAALRDWQIKAVCGGKNNTCNNGWMREIENAARPLLHPLITGAKIRLSVADQEKIATWAALKAMVSEYDAADCVTTHHMQRKRMRRLKKPPTQGWAIWIGRLERKYWISEFLTNAFHIVPRSRSRKASNDPPTYYNGHSTTQVVQKLFIQIVRCSVSEFVEKWRFSTPDGGTIFRIWPPSRYSINWPAAALTDRDAGTIATAIDNALTAAARRR